MAQLSRVIVPRVHATVLGNIEPWYQRKIGPLHAGAWAAIGAAAVLAVSVFVFKREPTFFGVRLR